jgi:peptidoglycan/xylan/chitin deacetylase (PgdA/CDA1 family)
MVSKSAATVRRQRAWAVLGCLGLVLVACQSDARAVDQAAKPGTVAGVPGGQPGAGGPGRAVALTIDDLPVNSTQRDTLAQWAVTRAILTALRGADAPAIGFVNEGKLGTGAASRAARIRMLRAWLDAGHDLGNHSYSHADLHSETLSEYTADIVRGEEETTRLRGARPSWFRHPYLHAGNDSAKKAGLEAFLAERGYRVAPVTVDNGEYIFARAYDRALDRGDTALVRRIADAYVPYMDTIFGFYEAQSRHIVGREIPQVLLLHANRINADRLDELLAMMGRRGYRFVTLDEALRDPAYDRATEYIGPAGITWLHRWAIVDGVDRSIFRGEPEVPELVAEMAG